MADDVLFEFLHMEIVSYVENSAKKDEKVNTEQSSCFFEETKLPKSSLRGHRTLDQFGITHYSASLIVSNGAALSEDQLVAKLEKMGYRVGQSVAERFTRDTPRFSSELDIIKFICKDFWSNVCKKQIDNLRTNHQGVYVLQDNKFRFLVQMSASKQYLEAAPKYLAYTCGLVRGALANLGLNCIVTAEVSTMPACKFQIMIQRS